MKERVHLLVPTHGTPHCRLAVQLGARLAKRYDGILTVMTVVDRRAYSKQGEIVLDKAVSQANAEGITPETILRIGKASRKIVMESKTLGVDLITMGSRPWHKFLRSLLGSTSQDVVAHAPCPVLFAKGEASLPGKILVCESGALTPRLVERLIDSLPFLLHEEIKVTVLHVMSQMSAGPGIKGWELRASADALVEAHTPEGELLESDAELLEKVGVQPKFLVRHGLVVEEIMSEAVDGAYDLIVIGAHQYRGWQALLLDDLQQQIISCLNRPVLVVR